MKRGKEWYIQRECVQWFRENYPEFIIFSVPNEAAWKNKPFFAATGLLDGVSDLIAVTDSDIYFIETKSETVRQTPAQKEFQSKVESLGWKYFIVRDVETFVNIFEENRHFPKVNDIYN